MSFVNGLGWFIGNPGLDYAGKVVWHDGGTPNFFGLVVCIPERKLGITLLTNSSTGALMNHFLSVEILQLLLREDQGLVPPLDMGRIRSTIMPDKMQSVAERFFTLSGIAHVFVSGKHLIAALPSGRFRLMPCKDGWFNVILLLFGFLPLKLKKLAMIRVGILEIDGEKIFALEQLGFRSPQGKPFRPLRTSDAWKLRTGHFVCTDEKNPRLKSISLRSMPEGMAISISSDKTGRMNMFLDIANDSEAITVGYGRFGGETILATDDTITVLGLTFRNTK